MSQVQEYLAYVTDPSSGFNVPIVAVVRFDGLIVYRDFLREDLPRIPEVFSIPGGWFFKRNNNSANSWTRRFGILRGKYMFLFHSPLNERPIALVSLVDKEIYIPDGGEKYEWEIRSTLDADDITQIYSLSDQERKQWVAACEDRIQQIEGGKPIQILGRKIPTRHGSNVTITGTRLEGNSPSTIVAAEELLNQSAGHSYYPAPPPPPPGDGDDDSSYMEASFYRNQNQVPFASDNSFQMDQLQPPLPESPIPMNESELNADNWDSYPGQSPDARNVRYNNEDDDENSYVDERAPGGLESSSFGQPVVKVHDEARKREAAVREIAHSKQYLKNAKEEEANNPMTLAEMIRYMLFFMHEVLCEDPLPNLPLQIPCLKGEYAEGLVTSVYQAYCSRDTGNMSLERFVDFVDDLGILQTHVPHDGSDAPLAQYEALLDPIRLLSTIPRNLGHSNQIQKESMLRRKSMLAASGRSLGAKDDDMSVNFTQFYQLLLQITQIVYKDMYEKDMTVALNNFLIESMCPLFAWVRGQHNKRGTTDPLVKEERIALLLIAYSPNIWKVFLMYAHNSIKKAPEESCLQFPDVAKANEKALFGVPPGCPNRAFTAVNGSTKDYLVISESSFMRLCMDYGLCPHLQTVKQCKDVFHALNRSKCTTKSVTKDIQAPTAASQLTRAAKGKKTTIFKGRRPSASPMYFGRAEEGRTASPPAAPGPGHIDAPALPVVQLASGLAFSEFVEAISRIAVEGLQQENYHILFPTPFSKILAMLTIWGLADLQKLEDVKAIHTIAVEHSA